MRVSSSLVSLAMEAELRVPESFEDPWMEAMSVPSAATSR